MKTVVMILGLLCPVFCSGQQASGPVYADSLEASLHKRSSDTARAKTLFLLSQYWADLDSARGVHYAQEGRKYSPGGDFYEGQAHYYMGNALFEYDIPRAKQEYRQAQVWLQRVETQAGYALCSKAWHNYGALEERTGDEQAFADILLHKVIPLALKAGDTLHVGIYYMSVGVVFTNIFDYDRSNGYYKQAARILARYAPAQEHLINCYSKIADNYLSKEAYPMAAVYLDSAAQYLDAYPGTIYLPSYYLARGRYYNGVHQYGHALESLHKGLQVADSLHRAYDATAIMMVQYQTYKAQRAYAQAKAMLLTIYQRPYVAEMPENMRLVLRELASTDSALHHPAAAYQWLLQYGALTDSLAGEETDLRVQEMEARYNMARQEKELLQLHAKAQWQRFLLWGSLGLLALVLAVSGFVYQQRKLRNAQQIRSLEQAHAMAIAQALLDGEERERGRLARDLHDGLGGTLAGVRIHLSEAAEAPQALGKVIHQLDAAISDLRRIARNMMPEALLHTGLEAALADLCASVSSAQLSIAFQAISLSTAPGIQVQLIIYRIVQELLANIVKHAAATEAFVQCSRSEDLFFITVEDNGKGFDEAEAGAKQGIGWRNIRNRVAFLHGQVDIRSQAGKGTAVNISLSCNQHPATSLRSL